MTPEEIQRCLERRRYVHFDERPTRAALEALITSPKRVSQRAFLPFLKTDVVTRKLRRQPGKTFERTSKSRPICFAGHKDSAIYSYYCRLLHDQYEQKLVAYGLSNSVTAFRAIGKSNIELADEVFKWIDSRRPCYALAFDVEKFFDTLDHAVLKHRWLEVAGKTRLDEDEFAVFKSITAYAWVDRIAALKALGISRYNVRSGDRTRLCSPEEFRTKIRAAGLVKAHAEKKGIPQGSPISAALSNVYMLHVDRAILNFTTSVGGLYRRYCDDILVVVPPEHVDTARTVVTEALKAVSLNIQATKTLECEFYDSKKLASRPLQYLGLVFDGERTLLRSSGIARYHAKMRAGVRLANLTLRKAARDLSISPSTLKIKKKKLRRKYTHHGKLNFVQYAMRASRITGSAAIKKQVQNSAEKLSQLVTTAESRNILLP